MKLGERRMADHLVKVIEDRIMSRMGSYARLNHRYGTVATGGAAGERVSIYVGGDTSYASPNFTNLTGGTLAVNNIVLVVIDPLGDRYVDKKL